MSAPTPASLPALDHRHRAALLFTNFLLIILAYYPIKAASKSLFIGYWGAKNQPYVWIATAVVLGLLVGFYHRIVERHSRVSIVLTTLVSFALLLVAFSYALETASGPAVAAVFYIFVDIFSVVLVEQFWSLTNNVHTTEAGKRWYGFVGTGGLVGGALGSLIAGRLVGSSGVATEDLLLFAAAILALLFALNVWMSRLGVYRDSPESTVAVVEEGGWRVILRNRYLISITAIILFSQMVETFTEFQFNTLVEQSYPEKDARTVYISDFLLALNLVAIAVNLALTPLVHRRLGVMAGLTVQPLLVGLFAGVFLGTPILLVASLLKIADRGMSYSINRASKEVLYIPIDPVQTYQAKAWIDMFGYRLFKVVGSVLLLLPQWLMVSVSLPQLSIVTVAVCLVWLAIIGVLASEYRTLLLRSA